MDLIDVTVVGGPDVAAEVLRTPGDGGTVLDITLRSSSEVPARLRSAAVVIESPSVGEVTALGWDAADPGAERTGPGPGLVGSPGVVTDRGAVGWMGSAAHRGEVALQADGWLVTAWAELDGLILWPGEATSLDPLWVGDAARRPDAADAWAAAWAGRTGPLRPVADEVEVGAGGAVAVAPFGGVDLSRPGTAEALRAAGEELAAGGATWVAVTGTGAACAPGHRWGEASTTPVAAVRTALAALRDGLGAGPVLHLAGGPPAVGCGVADVVDTGPGWPSHDPASAPRRRAWLHGRVWWACPGPIRPGAPARVVSELAGLGGTLVRWPSPPEGRRRPDGPPGGAGG